MPWLMKAEPDSRVVKGKDVKTILSSSGTIILLIDWVAPDTEADHRESPSGMEGVRSHEARNIMRDKMKLGDKVLFYHSNTKVPGIFAIAEVAREGYPDWSAWDPAHPYFDPKTDKDNPTWMMVDVKFIQRLAFPPTLALIKYLASISALPECISYIGVDGLKAVQGMQLVNRGRLSVQPVEPDAFEAVLLLGTRGGWEELVPAKAKAKGGKKADDEAADGEEKPEKPGKKKGRQKADDGVENSEEKPEKKKGRKRASAAGRTEKGKEAADEEKVAAAEPATKAEEKAEIKVDGEAVPDDNRRRSKRVKR